MKWSVGTDCVPNVPHVGKRKPTLDLCKTRWAERHNAYQHFYQAFTYIVKALEVIGYRRHLNKYGDLYADWDPANHTEAQQIAADGIISFTFIIGFLTVYRYLSHLNGITVTLPWATCDIMKAHQLIASVTTTYKEERKNVDSGFSDIYAQSERMANAVGTTVGMPRLTGRQQHRTNPVSSTPLDYIFQKSVLPFHLLTTSSLPWNFSSLNQLLLHLHC